MPNRELREGIVSSEAINRLSDLAELLFHRMLVTADNFGLIELGAAYLKAKALPARNWSFDQIDALVKELTDPPVGKPLVRRYEANGKQYGAIDKWKQRVWAGKPKFPEPPWGREHITGGYADNRIKVDGVAPEKRRAPQPINGSPRRGGRDWWASEAGIEAKGKEVGLTARTGESWPEYKVRITEAIDKQRKSA